MFLVSLHFLRAAHTLHCLARYFFFPSPPPTFFQVCVFRNHQRVCLVSPVLAPFSGNWRSLELDSQRFWTSDTQDLPTSCMKFLYFTLFVFSVLYTKMHWRVHSLADIVPPLLTILQFSSELSNKRGTGLPCLRPLWIYCTGQQHKASFPCLFSCLSSLCLQLLCHGLYLSFTQVLSFHTCTITSPFLQNADFPFFKRLPSPSRSCGMPLLALLVP